MSKKPWRYVAALSALAVVPTASNAQPPPPPPPGFPDYVRLLSDAYNRRDSAAYGELFQEEVTVYVDGTLVASTRTEYLARIQSEFDANMHTRPLSWAQGSQIMVMEEVTGCIPVNPRPSVVYHGCTQARAVRYDLSGGHKIGAVHILRADRAWNIHSAAR